MSDNGAGFELDDQVSSYPVFWVSVGEVGYTYKVEEGGRSATRSPVQCPVPSV